jgi:hypothetical protein
LPRRTKVHDGAQALKDELNAELFECPGGSRVTHNLRPLEWQLTVFR